MNRLPLFKVLVAMAFRNLRNHAGKTLIVGSILFFGTALWTVGSSLVSSVERAMAGTVIDSVAGDLQIYQKDTRDQLALFGGGTMGAADIGEIPSFAALQTAVAGVPNIRALVPMGNTVALLLNPSPLDHALGDLREAVRDGDAAAEQDAMARSRFLIGNLLQETQSRALANSTDDIRRNIEALRYAASVTFWNQFAGDKLGNLEYLDTKIAPLGTEGSLVYMRILGTDIEQYRHEFSKFAMLEGEPVPPGARGFMMPERFRDMIKNKVAREFDLMKEKRELGDTFANNEALREQAKRNVRQYKRVLTALNAGAAPQLEAVLRDELGHAGALDALLQEFLQVDDTNFARRFDVFYAKIAPLIELYPVKVGETVTVRAFTRSGYMRSANLKLYGIFRFKGMEDSDLAGVFNLVDISTFRELYGAATVAQREELAGLKSSIGLQDVGRDDAEAALFGGGDLVVEEKSAKQAEPDLAREDEAAPPPATPEEIRAGLALHAAVLLEDQSRAAETAAKLEDAIKQANLPLRVVPWHQAVGFVGQLTLAMRAVLIFGMVIIFLVALVVVNNTVIISTMERVNEIGTLRAIGAQRPFVLWMFLLETTTIAVLAGILGAGFGVGLVELLGVKGIPAFTRNINFLFGGPRLYPSVGVIDAVSGLVIILVVSVAATFFPARAATRVQPVEAMRAD